MHELAGLRARVLTVADDLHAIDEDIHDPGGESPWLIEGGKGTKPLAAHFQLRPDPLAH